MKRVSTVCVSQLQSLPIAEVVTHYTRKNVSNNTLLCPFHNEKTPSCHIYPQTNKIHCFGCGAHENTIGFVMRYTGLGFVEACKNLCDAFSIEFVEENNDNDTTPQKEEYQHKQELLQLTKSVQQLAIQYLHNTPDLPPTLIPRFGNPADPDSWCAIWGLGFLPIGSLRTYAQEHNCQHSLLELGLLKQSPTNGSYYSPFENRLLIPILNPIGQPVAFAARTLSPHKTNPTPKYINSPTSAIFKKGDLLFGLSDARAEVTKSKTIFLVEGYTDVMRLVAHGLTNTVARMGTALTEAQSEQLNRMGAELIIILPDHDAAGIAAAKKDALQLLQKGFVVKISLLGEEGDDPDSVFKTLEQGQ